MDLLLLISDFVKIFIEVQQLTNVLPTVNLKLKLPNTLNTHIGKQNMLFDILDFAVINYIEFGN